MRLYRRFLLIGAVGLAAFCTMFAIWGYWAAIVAVFGAYSLGHQTGAVKR